MLLGEFIINHINEISFVDLQGNNVCLKVSVNERVIQTNANTYKNKDMWNQLFNWIETLANKTHYSAFLSMLCADFQNVP